MEKKRQYSRVDKPPFSYVAITAMALQSAPGQSLRLGQIVDKIIEMFPTMEATRSSWRDSVRHNLPKYNCFYINDDNLSPSGERKGNF